MTSQRKLNRKTAMQKMAALVMGIIIASVIIIHGLQDGIDNLLSILSFK
jgi:hypothetical protein